MILLTVIFSKRRKISTTLWQEAIVPSRECRWVGVFLHTSTRCPRTCQQQNKGEAGGALGVSRLIVWGWYRSTSSTRRVWQCPRKGKNLCFQGSSTERTIAIIGMCRCALRPSFQISFFTSTGHLFLGLILCAQMNHLNITSACKLKG